MQLDFRSAAELGRAGKPWPGLPVGHGRACRWAMAGLAVATGRVEMEGAVMGRGITALGSQQSHQVLER
jgi:hypothetical protein